MIQPLKDFRFYPFWTIWTPPYPSTNNTSQWALLLPPHLTIEGVGRVTTLILVCNSWCSKSPKSTTKQPPSSHSPILPQLDLLYPPPVQQWVHHPPVWSLCVQQRTVWEKYPSTCKASLVKLGRVSSQIQVLFSTATVSKQAEGKRWVSTQQPSVSMNKTTMYPLHTHTQLFQQVVHLPPTFVHPLWWLLFHCFSFLPLTVSLFPPFLPLSITIQLWRWHIQAQSVCCVWKAIEVQSVEPFQQRRSQLVSLISKKRSTEMILICLIVNYIYWPSGVIN